MSKRQYLKIEMLVFYELGFDEDLPLEEVVESFEELYPGCQVSGGMKTLTEEEMENE